MPSKTTIRATRHSTLINVFLVACCGLSVGCFETNSTATAKSKAVARVASSPRVMVPDAAPPSDAAVLPANTAPEERPDVAAPPPRVERAILVSVDGLGGQHLITQFGKGKLPAFASLRQAGSSTLNARTDYDNNYTLPNHTSMLTGRPVGPDLELPATTHHGWTINGVVSPDLTLHNGGNPNLRYVGSIFDVSHDRGKKTCMYAGKLKFALYSNSYDALHGAVDTIGSDNGRKKLDRSVLLEQNTELLVKTIETDLIEGICDVVFVHIADLDALGHASGWGTDTWYAALDRVDDWIGRLAKFTSSNSPGGSWGLVLTADHGGLPEGHGDPTDPWNFQIPFFVVAKGIAPGSDLYTLAAGARRDPGRERQPYSASNQPIRNGDAANVMMSLLGLPAVPGSLMRGLLPPQ